jgi:pyruvate/2-oxoglutarate/acetoin dehydrogenase E1 component
MRQMTGGHKLSFSQDSFSRTIRATHSQALENWFATHRLKVVVPSTVYDAKDC